MQHADWPLAEVALLLIGLAQISFLSKTGFDRLGRDQSSFRFISSALPCFVILPLYYLCSNITQLCVLYSYIMFPCSEIVLKTTWPVAPLLFSLSNIFLHLSYISIRHFLTILCLSSPCMADCPEAEFLDVIGTKVLRDFLLAIHSHLYKSAKVVWNCFVV